MNGAVTVRVAAPAEFSPAAEVVSDAERRAAETGGSVLVVTDPVAAVAGSDVVVTDTWVSMGKEDEKQARLDTFNGYRVDDALMAHAADDAVFMHCLPAHREDEVTSAVMDGPHSVIWDEAENRLHAQKAVMRWCLGV